MRTWRRHARAAVIACLLLTQQAAADQEGEQELGAFSQFVRVGLGHALVDQSTVLGPPLALSAETDGLLLALPEMPEACFRPPGVTAVNGMPVATARDLLVNTEVIARAGVAIEVQCGDKNADALPIVQIPLDGAWKRFVNPTVASVNTHLEGSYDLQLRRAEVDMSADDDLHRISRNRFGGIDFVNGGPLSSGVRFHEPTGLYYEAHMIRIHSDEFAGYAEEVLQRMGCETVRIPPEDGYERVVIRGQTLDPSAVLAYNRDMLLTSLGLLSLQKLIERAALEDAMSRHSRGVRTRPEIADLVSALPGGMCKETFEAR